MAAGAGGALARMLKNRLFHVSATDPVVFGSVAVALIGVTLLASLVPAMRAIGVDPIRALHHE